MDSEIIFTLKKEILFKEMDMIHSTIKNLDELIYRSKNFAFLLWGGSIYVITQAGEWKDAKIQIPIIFIIIIPILFWVMDFYWRKALLKVSARERMISCFINSPYLEQWINTGIGLKFPLYDPIGWFSSKNPYHEESLKMKNDAQQPPINANEFIISVFKYLQTDNNSSFFISPITFRQTIFYKEGIWFYSIMILISIILQVYYLLNSC